MEKAIYGGASLGRAPADDPELAGKAVFVPLALPGELVDVTVASSRRSYISAFVDAVIEGSASRIQPRCEYFSRCGGCHYQHADYAAQLEMKAAILTETLARAHVSVPESLGTLADEPWGYRNRVRLHVRQQPSPALCYREAASHRDLPVDHCPVAAPSLQQAIAALTHLLGSQPPAARHVTEVELFTDADESALLLSLYAAQPVAELDLRNFAETLLKHVPTLKGVSSFAGRADLAERSSADRQSIQKTSAHWSAQALEYAVGPRSYRVSTGAFFQVNRLLVPALLDEVTTGRTGALAWDLYAGGGLFAQVLAENFERVIAVESSPLSFPDLQHNLRSRGNQCVSSDTLRFLRRQNGSRPRRTAPDLVVVDPPRAGLGAEVSAELAKAAPRQIVYVSCDPATLARDLRALQPSGYRLSQVTLVDLFPQTFHLETVAVLDRG
jgi:23S rRNA (uracil1939-C5)-methyltransferase